MLEIIVKPTLGSYCARAKGYKPSASRSEGPLQAAQALLRKLELTDGQLKEQENTQLQQGRKLFHFVQDSEAKYD
ncbi:hypothetical protein [Pseudomonas sp. RTCS2]|uniref:hypothetical protein n=1 Tax=Pseudomonas sp. RTCS2 TaxID=3389877 RepID=UPI0039E35CB1